MTDKQLAKRYPPGTRVRISPQWFARFEQTVCGIDPPEDGKVPVYIGRTGGWQWIPHEYLEVADD
jgi:uncharacterized protein YndB with AHSA1/START domain